MTEYPVTLFSIFLHPRVEYRLTAANASEGMQSRELALNGVALHVSDQGALPALTGASVRAETTLMAVPVSIGWAVYPEAKAPACMQ